MAARAEARYILTAEDKTARAFRSARRNISSVTRSLGGFASALGVTAGVGGFGFLIKQTAEAGDQIGKLSTRLGVSTEFLSEMQHVAARSGVTFQSFTMSIQRMARRIGQGSKQTVETIKELGLSFDEIRKMDAEGQFLAVAEAMEGVTDQGRKLAIAMQLFDTEGVSMLQTMEGGASAINAVRREARELGKSLTKEQTEQFAKFEDAVENLTTGLGGLANTLTLAVLPALTDFFNSISERMPEVNRITGRVLNDGKEALKDLGGIAGAVLAGDFEKAWELAGKSVEETLLSARAAIEPTIDEYGRFVDTAGKLKPLFEPQQLPQRTISRGASREELLARGVSSDAAQLTENIGKLNARQLDKLINTLENQGKERKEGEKTTQQILRDLVNSPQLRRSAAVAG